MLKFVLVNGQYVTTRGCSTFQWEDVGARLDHRNQHIPCIRRGQLERCLCSYDGCNGASQIKLMTNILGFNLIALILMFQ